VTENFASRPAYAEADNGDYNTAVSMLFRWWGLFEAPAGVDISPFYADLFADDVHIDLPDGGVDITGVDAIQATMAALPAGIRRSHAINHDDIQVTALGDGLYRLQANYTYQLETDGKLVSGHSHCDNILRKVAPARMVYTRVSGGLGDTFERPEFVDSYVENRIKAVLIQWQAVMDTLNGNAAPLEELVMPRLEFHGLISSKQDQSDGRAETVTDFKEMKGILAGTDGSEDTIIRGFEGVQENGVPFGSVVSAGRSAKRSAAERKRSYVVEADTLWSKGTRSISRISSKFRSGFHRVSSIASWLGAMVNPSPARKSHRPWSCRGEAEYHGTLCRCCVPRYRQYCPVRPKSAAGYRPC
jgi:hypothetical protein